MAENDFATRIATPDDAEAVRALLAASYPTLLAPAYDAVPLAAALPLMTQANPSLLESGTYYVAESRGGLVVGCGGWSRERPGSSNVEPRLGHIRHFGTHPDWTNRGIARALYRRCETSARAAGIRAFECYSSLNAERFYAAVGFETLRRIDLELAADVVLASVLMRREI